MLTNFNSQDFINKAIIEPPKDIIDDFKKTRVIVDSRIRNKNLFPSQNSYDIQFDDDINDVSKCELIYADIPMPLYLINKNFNTITFTINAITYNIILESGDYSISELATALQTQMANEFIVEYVPRTDNFRFTNTSAFSIDFTPVNNLSMLLGFRQQVYHSNNFVINSEFRKNLNYNNYLIMDIEQFDVLKSSDKDLNKTFAIIPKHYNDLNICDDIRYIKKFSPPIPKLARLKIKFYDKFGNPYDFQNMDHRFELMFENYRQRRKYHV